MANQPNTIYCPVCDRPYTAIEKTPLLEVVKKHVAGQHPEYDPDWWETYPDDVLA